MPALKVTESRMIATSNGSEVTTILVEPDKAHSANGVGPRLWHTNTLFPDGTDG